MNIWQDFITNDQRLITKWEHYFPIYERYFTPWRNKTLTFVEIGVEAGGSLQMWRRFFGPMATIIGIDINPNCKAIEEPGIHVRIGDQGDTAFLQTVIDEFGAPDIVLDDGSHKMDDLRASFDFLYPRLSKNGLYMAEDLHTAYWPHYGGGVDEPASFIAYCKGLIDRLNAVHSVGKVKPDFVTRHTLGISFYDSIVVLERGTTPRRIPVGSGGPADLALWDGSVPYMDPLGED